MSSFLFVGLQLTLNVKKLWDLIIRISGKYMRVLDHFS